jgi:hypothetical protein
LEMSRSNGSGGVWLAAAGQGEAMRALTSRWAKA